MNQIQLNEGERYIGAITTPDGVTTHTILLPGEFVTTWQDAMDKARNIGGDLPTRIEQLQMSITADKEFKYKAYWSNEPESFRCSWCFLFGENYIEKHNKEFLLHARAVRRVVIF